MNEELARIRERLLQARQARAAKAAGVPATTAPGGTLPVAPLAPGGRVFDTVSGQEGVIVGRTRENLIVHPRAE